MKDKLLHIFSTKTVKQSAITSLSTVVSGLLGIGFYILLGRFLGPERFGIVSVSILTLTLISDIANVGTDTGIVRFVGKYKTTDPDKALRFLKLGLKVKFAVGLAILVVGWFVTPWVAGNILKKTELIEPLKYSLLGSLGILLFSFTTSAIQAYEKFKVWGIVNICLNFLRLVGIIVLFLLGGLTINNSLFMYILFPFVGFLVGSLFLPRYIDAKDENGNAKEFFHYNKWVALFILLAAISSRLDTYISTKLLSLSDVGIYSAAVTLASVGTQIVAGIATVVAPKLAAFDTHKKAFAYLKNLQLFTIILGIVAVLVGLPLAYILIPVFFGTEFSDTFNPFTIHLVAQVVFLISIPVHTAVFYYFSKPSLFVWISLVHIAIIGVLGWILISNFGYMGASIAVLIGNISNFVIPAVWVVRRFKVTKSK